MARKIVITSGKGGVGKTTICANLGISLARQNKRVVMLDLDIGLNNLDLLMGVENKVTYDIVDVIDGLCRAKQALVQDIKYSNLYIMPSIHSYGKSRLTGENIVKVVEDLEDFFDFILIDSPAGIDAPFKRAVLGANEAIIVVTPHFPSIRDADKVVMLLNEFGVNIQGLVINRLRGDLVLNKEIIEPKKICEILNLELLGVIPEDDNLCFVNNKGESRIAFSMLAKNLIGDSKKIYDCTEKYRGFLGFLRRKIKKRV